MNRLPPTVATVLLTWALTAAPACAWHDLAHGVVGILAVERLDDDHRAAFATLFDPADEQRIAEACIWPDTYKREEPAGAWSSPLHFVNIDPVAESYRRARDCPGGKCLPAALERFTAALGDTTLPTDSRRRAFAFVCHLAADLHQPLHVAWAEDRGGNDVSIEHEGEDSTLHAFWDGALVSQLGASREELLARLRAHRGAGPEGPWQPGDLVTWANETYTFTRLFAYPPQGKLDEAYVERSRRVVMERLDRAASRLAVLLEATLAPPEAAGG